jgi:hypothetical protein
MCTCMPKAMYVCIHVCSVMYVKVYRILRPCLPRSRFATGQVVLFLPLPANGPEESVTSLSHGLRYRDGRFSLDHVAHDEGK